MITTEILRKTPACDIASDAAYAVAGIVETARLALEGLAHNGDVPAASLFSIMQALEVAGALSGVVVDGAESLERRAGRGVRGNTGHVI